VIDRLDYALCSLYCRSRKSEGLFERAVRGPFHCPFAGVLMVSCPGCS
jgi:hypothetical protein